MKNISLIILIGFIIIGCNEKNSGRKIQETKTVLTQEVNKEISKLIDSLYVVDQKVQTDLIEASQNGDNEKVMKLFSEEKIIFKRHIPILKEIFKKIGYPTIELVGKESAYNFFIMVQHSDADVKFQNEMLQEMSKEVKLENVDRKDFAFLTDRVQLALQNQQIYGTQVDYNMSICQAYPKQLKDSIHVNELRKEMGLAPIQEYLNELTKMHFESNQEYYSSIGIKEPKLYKTE